MGAMAGCAAGNLAAGSEVQVVNDAQLQVQRPRRSADCSSPGGEFPGRTPFPGARSEAVPRCRSPTQLVLGGVVN
jgi:hypothetical protein